MANPLQELAAAGLINPELVQQALRVKALRDIWNAGYQTPEAQRALIDRSTGVAPTMNLAGGLDIARLGLDSGIATNAYSLGRAGLAANLANDTFAERMALADRAGSPFNVVSYLDGLARTGTMLPLNNRIVENLQPMTPAPADTPERMKLRDFLKSDTPQPFARGGGVMLERPKVLVDAWTGQAEATLAENGPERMHIQPQPGVSRKLGRRRQGFILDEAVGKDRRYGTLDDGVPAKPNNEARRPRLGRRVKGYAGGTRSLQSALAAKGITRTAPTRTPTRPSTSTSVDDEQARIARLAATPGAAEAYAAYDRNRAASTAPRTPTAADLTQDAAERYAAYDASRAAAAPARGPLVEAPQTGLQGAPDQANVPANLQGRALTLIILPDGSQHLSASSDGQSRVYDRRVDETGLGRAMTAQDLANFKAQESARRMGRISVGTQSTPKHQQMATDNMELFLNLDYDGALHDPSKRSAESQALVDRHDAQQPQAARARNLQEKRQAARDAGISMTVPKGATKAGQNPYSYAGGGADTPAGPKLGRRKKGATVPGGTGSNTGQPSKDEQRVPRTDNQAPNNAQQAAAKLLAAVVDNPQFPEEFKAALRAGQVPGISTINLAQFESLTPELQAVLVSLWKSTGQVGTDQSIADVFERGRPR